MAKLIYVANTSLDGYSEDRDGGIDWGVPDEEYFSFINDLERTVGTYLYGRRMYETMVYWETAPIADQPPWVADFANIWRAADKSSSRRPWHRCRAAGPPSSGSSTSRRFGG